MSNIKFKVKETAGDDDHKMYTELSIKGESNEVARILKHWLGVE